MASWQFVRKDGSRDGLRFLTKKEAQDYGTHMRVGGEAEKSDDAALWAFKDGVLIDRSKKLRQGA